MMAPIFRPPRPRSRPSSSTGAGTIRLRGRRTRTRTIAVGGLLMIVGLIGAAGQEAKVRTSLSTQGDLYVGERLTLVVELLAPGFFASAPTFDLPDPAGVLLMPPTGHPVLSSEEIDGVSYTVQRHELFAFPRRGGRQTIPSLPVRFAFKRSPLDASGVSATLKTDPVQFTVLPPPGAEALGNVISARNLKVEEIWQPELGKAKIKPGDAFTRTITFTAPNLPGMLFPPFPTNSIDGVGIYAKHQVLDQTERGALRGQRQDIITYVCQRPGEFTIPAARLTWWDLDGKQLRSIDFPAHVLDVEGASAQTSPPKWVAWWKPVGLVVLIVLALALLCHARLRPVFAAVFAKCRPVHLVALNPISRSH